MLTGSSTWQNSWEIAGRCTWCFWRVTGSIAWSIGGFSGRFSRSGQFTLLPFEVQRAAACVGGGSITSNALPTVQAGTLVDLAVSSRPTRFACASVRTKKHVGTSTLDARVVAPSALVAKEEAQNGHNAKDVAKE